MTDTGLSELTASGADRLDVEPAWMKPRLRNHTPDRLTLAHNKRSIVLAPLESRTIPPDAEERSWPWEELIRRGILDWEDEFAAAPEHVRPLTAGGVAIAFAVPTLLAAVGIVAAQSSPPIIVVALAALGSAFLLGIGLILGRRSIGKRITRQTTQLFMLALVVTPSIATALFAVRLGPFTEFGIWEKCAVAGLLAIATMMPGLLFFLFDRQRLSTLRQRFERQIFRLDPSVSTLGEVYARYGDQIREAYYDRDATTTATVAQQRRWPIVIATITIGIGWSLALWPEHTGRADAVALFEVLADPVSFAFLGAYFFAVNTCLRRYARNDLRPKAYSAITVRILVALILACLLQALIPSAPEIVSLPLAFAVGVIPETALVLLRDKLRPLGVDKQLRHLEQQLPLDRLEGLDLYDRARLLDEGVANIEGLAHDDLVDLLLETRIPAARLVDWVDQAVLYLHLVDSSLERDEQGEDVRRRLRALGVRTATDLLQAAEKCAHRPLLIDAVKRGGDSSAMATSRLQHLIATMCDDEWMDHVRAWRTRAQVRDRRIRIGPTGAISQTFPTPPGQHYECPAISPATPNATAPTTASPPPPTPPAGTDRS